MLIASNKTTTVTDVALQFLLVFAMTLPMLILYATSTLGLLLSSDLGFEATSLGYLIMSSFGLAAVLSLYAGRTVDCYGSRQALLILFCAVAMAFSVIAVAVDFYGLCSPLRCAVLRKRCRIR